jgi:hypothetical protein
MGPGTRCYGYLECVKLIRAGTAVDYSGVTGEMDYAATGVVSGIYGIFRWTSLSKLESLTTLDGAAVFALEKNWGQADRTTRADEAGSPLHRRAQGSGILVHGANWHVGSDAVGPIMIP